MRWYLLIFILSIQLSLADQLHVTFGPPTAGEAASELSITSQGEFYYRGSSVRRATMSSSRMKELMDGLGRDGVWVIRSGSYHGSDTFSLSIKRGGMKHQFSFADPTSPRVLRVKKRLDALVDEVSHTDVSEISAIHFTWGITTGKPNAVLTFSEDGTLNYRDTSEAYQRKYSSVEFRKWADIVNDSGFWELPRGMVGYGTLDFIVGLSTHNLTFNRGPCTSQDPRVRKLEQIGNQLIKMAKKR